jgi:DNA-binding transcriptional MerR regulator
LGASLENAWRRSKDLHRRQYLSWLQTLGLILPDINEDINEDHTCNEKSNRDDNENGSNGRNGTITSTIAGPTAMFTEFPMTIEESKHLQQKKRTGENVSNCLLKQRLPDMLEHAVGAVVGTAISIENGQKNDTKRIKMLENEVAKLKKQLMELKK